MKPDSQYIHGTNKTEQERLVALNRLTNAAFVEFLELRPDSVVLEVGSGLGILAGEVAARAPRGEVIGIEYSPEQLAAAHVTRPNLRFEQGDAHRLPFEGARFDVVYCRYLLEHVADPVQVLREMRRVLRPSGGRACIQENNVLANEFYPECPRFDSVWEKFAALQSKLLRALETRSFFRVGGVKKVEVDVRLIAATKSTRPTAPSFIKSKVSMSMKT